MWSLSLLREKEMATHSSILAWQATVRGVTRVGHDLATKPTPPPKPAQPAPIWENAFPSTLLPFSSIPMFWITPSYQGKISRCLEFLRFYQISVPIFWVLSPSPTKPTFTGISHGIPEPLRLPSAFTLLQPHRDSTLPPCSGLWSPWPPLDRFWFSTSISGHLFAASSTNSSSVCSQWKFTLKVLKQGPLFPLNPLSLSDPVNPHSFFTHHLHVDRSHVRSFFKQRRGWNGIAARKATASIFQRAKGDGRE